VFPDLGEDLISLVVSRIECHSSCNVLKVENLDAIECGVVGGIYSPNHQKWPLGGCLSHGAPDSPVRQPRHSTVRVRPLELLSSRSPDSPVLHRTVTVHCPVRLLALL
jgi:hypothetical protein